MALVICRRMSAPPLAHPVFSRVHFAMTAGLPNIKALLTQELGPETLAGVTMTQAGDQLVLTFAHPYLCDYWRHNFHSQLEHAIRSRLGRNLAIVYAGAPPEMSPSAEDAPHDHFSDFLVNARNSMALQAARDFCDPRKSLRSLLLTGETGSGKTHLLQGMAKCLRDSLGPARVLRTSAGSLPPPDFWQRGKALLVEDIQFCAAHELLVSHLDLAENAELRLAATCGKDLAQAHFPARLRQRLQKILRVHMPAPDLALRNAWLERENEKRRLGLSPAQLLTLARMGRHICQLEGLLQKFEFYSRVGDRNWVWEELEKLASPEQAQPWLTIFASVASRFAVPQTELAGTSRKREVALARQAAMYLCRQKLGLSYPELGRLFGGRDHATVIHSIRKIEKLRQVDKDLHNLLTELAEGIF